MSPFIGLETELAELIDWQYSSTTQSSGGAHLAKNLIDDAAIRLSTRLLDQSDNMDAQAQLPTQAAASKLRPMLLRSDFPQISIGIERGKGAIDKEVENLIGMIEAKQKFGNLQKVIKYAVRHNNRSVLTQCRNIVLTGNPGTGKTAFARLLF
eukprot:SAG31_NODE_15510_length_751_cov_1.116564_1_plen_152_part_10